jgi:hypothetical protein
VCVIKYYYGSKSRRKRWAKNVTCMGEFWSENQKGRDHSKDIDVDWKAILEWILGKQGGKMWTAFMWVRMGTSGGTL